MSFSFSPGMGPRGAIWKLGGTGEKGRLFNWRVITGMIVFLKPYRKRMALAFFLMLVVTGLTLLIPILIGITIDNYITVGDTSGLARMAILTAITFSALYGATATLQYNLSWVGQRVLADLREAL
ncbi:MAG: ABC transporter ATP-binding protein, partial [Chloroflexota bacterium]|nr:ABC transporter ATP-binding protein [Chloroflexota bacterium]